MGYLLDTSVAIHLRDNNRAIITAVGTLSPFPMLSAVTQVELEGGVHADPHWVEHRRTGLANILDTFDILDFTGDAAAAYGRIVASAGYSRRKVVDRMIAATAMIHHLTLVTTNGDDFADIADLDLLVWTI